MRLIYLTQDLPASYDQCLRRAGYALIHDRETGQYSYARRLSRDFYPRFHMYPKVEGENTVFDLHLDQKKASYAGTSRHSGEYDGPAVAQELSRLKASIDQLKIETAENQTKLQEASNIKSWWRKIFS